MNMHDPSRESRNAGVASPLCTLQGLVQQYTAPSERYFTQSFTYLGASVSTRHEETFEPIGREEKEKLNGEENQI